MTWGGPRTPRGQGPDSLGCSSLAPGWAFLILQHGWWGAALQGCCANAGEGTPGVWPLLAEGLQVRKRPLAVGGPSGNLSPRVPSVGPISAPALCCWKQHGVQGPGVSCAPSDHNIPRTSALGCSWSPSPLGRQLSPSGVRCHLPVVWAGIHLSDGLIFSEFHTWVNFTSSKLSSSFPQTLSIYWLLNSSPPCEMETVTS